MLTPYNCKCVYTGNQAAYDRYAKLAQEAAIAQEEQQAALMNEEAAMEMNSWDWGVDRGAGGKT